VNTGAIDDLRALAALCRRENAWFHVDGCIGALLTIAPENRHRVAGIELAYSIALDPHKWMHAPFEVGCALVHHAKAHVGLSIWRQNIWKSRNEALRRHPGCWTMASRRPEA
jgi:aromatic-L-amino-acid decarboxylase